MCINSFLALFETPNIAFQKDLAERLLQWHGGQGSSLYAVGSTMLSLAHKGELYDPRKQIGHYDGVKAFETAIAELRGMKRNAQHPNAVTPQDEKQCNDLAAQLEQFRPRREAVTPRTGPIRLPIR